MTRSEYAIYLFGVVMGTILGVFIGLLAAKQGWFQ